MSKQNRWIHSRVRRDGRNRKGWRKFLPSRKRLPFFFRESAAWNRVMASRNSRDLWGTDSTTIEFLVLAMTGRGAIKGLGDE